jgi:lysyl-tRNA synthetase class 2
VLEFYVAYKDYEWMMETTEQLLEKAAIATNGSSAVQVGEKEIDFKAPYKRISMYDSIKEFTGFDISEMDEDGIRMFAGNWAYMQMASGARVKLIDEIFGSKCEGNYIQPTFITIILWR